MFVTSCLLPWIAKLFQKGSTLKEKNLLLGANSFLYELSPTERKAKKTVVELHY